MNRIDTALFSPEDLKPDAVANWIIENAGSGARIGYDPWLHTPGSLKALKTKATQAGLELVPVDTNPVDLAWADRPAEPCAPVLPHTEEFSGISAEAKRTEIAKGLQSLKADIAIITQPASIAWAFNIRGGDVAHTPLALARAFLFADGKAELFLDPRKVSDTLPSHLGDDVTVRPPEAFLSALGALGQKHVSVDPATTPSAVFEALEKAGADIIHAPDPCIQPRAAKNETEISGTRAAHSRDGAALSRFLHWIDKEAPGGALTEIKAAQALEDFRRQTNLLKDVSFETISGSGPNGAIVHYRVTTASDRPLRGGDLYLVDSGAQYLDGTTDVTRTIPIGTPTDEMRLAFTCVLKGHISLATAKFPEGTCGVHLDALARMALWKSGLDYDHGTGHGVGSYLGVHEGPQNISKALRNEPLRPGMILSNEPGFYKTGAFGIRIENLILVTPPETPAGGERPMMGFETLTLAPIDRRLIISDDLNEEERTWLNAYHERVRTIIGPSLASDERAWLEEATRPL